MPMIYFRNVQGCDQASAAALRYFMRSFGVNAQEITQLPDNPEGIFFVHGMRETAKEAIATTYPNLHVIGVSSDPTSVSFPDGTLPNLHKCRHSTFRLADSPVQDFLKAYLRGEPLDWSKIEPLKHTDHLVALYLLELANQDTNEIRAMKQRVWCEAEREYSEITGATLRLPDDAVLRREALQGILASLATE